MGSLGRYHQCPFKRGSTVKSSSDLAFQKLQEYQQEPNQTASDFLSKMRKLFKETNPNMDETTKLQYLNTKINKSLKPDIFRYEPQPKTFSEFEKLAKSIENLHLRIESGTKTTTTSDSAVSLKTASSLTSSFQDESVQNVRRSDRASNDNNNVTSATSHQWPQQQQPYNRQYNNYRYPRNNYRNFGYRQYPNYYPEQQNSSSLRPSLSTIDNSNFASNWYSSPQQHLQTNPLASVSSSSLQQQQQPFTPVSAPPFIQQDQQQQSSMLHSTSLIQCQFCNQFGHTCHTCQSFQRWD